MNEEEIKQDGDEGRGKNGVFEEGRKSRNREREDALEVYEKVS